MLIEIVLEFPYEFLFPHWTRYKERQRKSVWWCTWHTFLYPWRQSIRKEKNNIFQWPWHLILMQKRKGMTAFEAESMKFLYISYDLVSLPPHAADSFIETLVYGPTVPQQCLWWHSGKFLTAVSFPAFLVYFIPSPQRHAFSGGISKVFIFHE